MEIFSERVSRPFSGIFSNYNFGWIDFLGFPQMGRSACCSGVSWLLRTMAVDAPNIPIAWLAKAGA